TYAALKSTIVVNGATTFMVGLSSAFAAYLSLAGIPRQLAAAMLQISNNQILLLVIINIFLLIVGCLVDNIPATIILAPILLPVVTSLGMSPVTFGVLITMNLAIGFCTPPYGIDLFVASAISGVSIGKMMKYMVWFILALFVVLAMVTYWPSFTMFVFN
ncbi:MAG: TRAP transporter large permease subunit, partial [Clostridia bacterium]|nr:TRAP transporter large permease subunit [Clostridia bacterium]